MMGNGEIMIERPRVTESCPACSNTGRDLHHQGPEIRPCRRCGGRKSVSRPLSDSSMIDLIWTKIGELQAAVVDLSKIDPIGWKKPYFTNDVLRRAADQYYDEFDRAVSPIKPSEPTPLRLDSDATAETLNKVFPSIPNVVGLYKKLRSTHPTRIVIAHLLAVEADLSMSRFASQMEAGTIRSSLDDAASACKRAALSIIPSCDLRRCCIADASNPPAIAADGAGKEGA